VASLVNNLQKNGVTLVGLGLVSTSNLPLLFTLEVDFNFFDFLVRYFFKGSTNRLLQNDGVGGTQLVAR